MKKNQFLKNYRHTDIDSSMLVAYRILGICNLFGSRYNVHRTPQ